MAGNGRLRCWIVLEEGFSDASCFQSPSVSETMDRCPHCIAAIAIVTRAAVIAVGDPLYLACWVFSAEGLERVIRGLSELLTTSSSTFPLAVCNSMPTASGFGGRKYLKRWRVNSSYKGIGSSSKEWETDRLGSVFPAQESAFAMFLVLGCDLHLSLKLL